MSRKSEFQTSSPNPATKFLEWKSEDQCFAFYNKAEQKNVLVPLPLKFLTLMEMHTVKGWNDASQSAIYSNEVKFIGQEELEVKSFKGGPIAKGLYKDVKHNIAAAGGHYTKSIYAMLEDGTIVNFQLKGSAVKEWGDFTQKSRSRLTDEWVEVFEANQLQKGKVKYSVPVFKYNTSLNDKEGLIADKSYNTLKEYIERYKGSNNTPIEAVEEEGELVPASLDDLDF